MDNSTVSQEQQRLPPPPPAPAFRTVDSLSEDDFKRARARLNKGYILWGEYADIVMFGLATKKNVIVFGKGGHAKSEMTDAFLDELNVDRFTQSCGAGLTEEKLFGGINLKKFNETGEIEYLTSHSFMAHEVVVFEELLDAPLHILLSLKDILTSKRFRQGSQQEAIKTKFIICLTNRSRAEVTEDNSIEAFLDRFPLEYQMEWKQYNSNNYHKLLTVVVPELLDEERMLLADMFSTLGTAGTFISPRTAVHAAQLFHRFGINSMRFLQGIDQSTIKDVEKQVEAKRSVRELKRIHDDLVKTKAYFQGVDVSKGDPIELGKQLKMMIGEVMTQRTDLAMLKVSGAAAEEQMKKCTELIKNITSIGAVKIEGLTRAAATTKPNSAEDSFRKLSGMLENGVSGDGYEEVVKDDDEVVPEEVITPALPAAGPKAKAPAGAPSKVPAAKAVTVFDVDDKPSLDSALDEIMGEYAKGGLSSLKDPEYEQEEEDGTTAVAEEEEDPAAGLDEEDDPRGDITAPKEDDEDEDS